MHIKDKFSPNPINRNVCKTSLHKFIWSIRVSYKQINVKNFFFAYDAFIYEQITKNSVHIYLFILALSSFYEQNETTSTVLFNKNKK